ncbi:hypothetical protein [Chitinibacter tainanensis]|uniref:hypothetical protein n=1 Tax=Chitinibacter tainanensis TaxID=230667 RepID=UPI0023533582|nr:hypothetical protein [Chitinibacter tainanensis]
MHKDMPIAALIELARLDLEGGVDLLAANIYERGSVANGISTNGLHQTLMDAISALFEGLAALGDLDAAELQESIAGFLVVAAVLRARLIEAAKAEQQNKGGVH